MSEAYILIVDDDAEVRELLAGYLGRNGYRTHTAGSAAAARRILATETPDLLVLDIMMPGESGLDLCRDLRAASSLPIIMLTARGDPLDRIVGLEMGADDYLAKPFEPRELLARIRSVLRRSGERAEGGKGRARRYLFAGMVLDTEARHLVRGDGVVVSLSGAEFRLLSIFVERSGRVLNRDQLMQATQGRDADVFDRSIDLQVSRLRGKLGDDARNPAIIKTVRNEGYVLAVPVHGE